MSKLSLLSGIIYSFSMKRGLFMTVVRQDKIKYDKNGL